MENERKTDWEKIGGYVLIIVSLVSLFFYIADMKERTRALEKDVEYIIKILEK